MKLIENFGEEVEDIFYKLREEVRTQYSSDLLAILISKDNFIPNTLLMKTIEFENPDSELDDYGINLSVTIQKYDPSGQNYLVSEDFIYFTADLCNTTGSVIEATGILKVPINNIDSLLDAMNQIKRFLDGKSTTIIEIMKHN